MNKHQAEAVAIADNGLGNAGLPTWSELVRSLIDIAQSTDESTALGLKQYARALLARIPA